MQHHQRSGTAQYTPPTISTHPNHSLTFPFLFTFLSHFNNRKQILTLLFSFSPSADHATSTETHKHKRICFTFILYTHFPNTCNVSDFPSPFPSHSPSFEHAPLLSLACGFIYLYYFSMYTTEHTHTLHFERSGPSEGATTTNRADESTFL